MNFLAISGSLRKHSSNTEMLRATRIIAPAHVEIKIYEELGELPHFNPDLESSLEHLPRRVMLLRQSVADADGLIISSPEYARGIPGSLKNALDWLVGSESFAGTPVTLFNASPRGVHAQAALRLTLETMAAWLIDQAFLTLPLLGGAASSEDIVKTYGNDIREVLDAFTRAAAEASALER
jgi:chromate reductase